MFMKLLPGKVWAVLLGQCPHSLHRFDGRRARLRDVFDAVKVFGATPDQCYRFVPVWNVTWLISAGIFYGLLYREWKALGGNSGT